jgi:uncharacterized protein
VKLEHRVEVRAPRERVWESLMDIPAVATCVPGVEEIVSHGDGHFHGRLKVGVGPIRLVLSGDLELAERDDAIGRAVLRGIGTDGRLGAGVRVAVTLAVAATADGSTELTIDSDVQVMGRIGDLGQPIMRRKADEILRSFAECLSRRLQ